MYWIKCLYQHVRSLHLEDFLFVCVSRSWPGIWYYRWIGVSCAFTSFMHEHSLKVIPSNKSDSTCTPLTFVLWYSGSINGLRGPLDPNWISKKAKRIPFHCPCVSLWICFMEKDQFSILWSKQRARAHTLLHSLPSFSFQTVDSPWQLHTNFQILLCHEWSWTHTCSGYAIVNWQIITDWQGSREAHRHAEVILV